MLVESIDRVWPFLLTIGARLTTIVSCPNQCGSVAVPQTANCGFGVVIADNVTAAACFSKALNIAPYGYLPSETFSRASWASLGCWTDADGAAHALGGGSSTASDMTVSKCVALARGFRYAGLEQGRCVLSMETPRDIPPLTTVNSICYWGNDIASTSSGVDTDECLTPCGGLVSEACGASQRMLIYENTTYTPPSSTTTLSGPTGTPTPTIVASVETFENPTCYTDSASRRILVNGTQSASDMTVAQCIALADGWKYAGIESGR